MRVSIMLTLLCVAPLGAAEFEKHLVAYWSFDVDIDGIVWDESGNGHHGTAYDVHQVHGEIGLAAGFNGYDTEIHIPDWGVTPPAEICGLEQGAISLWFKFQNQGPDILPILYYGESEAGGTPHSSLILEIGHGNDPDNRKLYFTIINQRFCFDSREQLKPDIWYHFVVVVGPEGNTGYLDGKELTQRHYNLGSDATYTDFFPTYPYRRCWPSVMDVMVRWIPFSTSKEILMR